jgi:hypothetical protein
LPATQLSESQVEPSSVVQPQGSPGVPLAVMLTVTSPPAAENRCTSGEVEKLQATGAALTDATPTVHSNNNNGASARRLSRKKSQAVFHIVPSPSLSFTSLIGSHASRIAEWA